MKEVVPSIPFANGMSYEFFLENFCYRCKKHKVNENGFCAFVADGGCPIENAMEDARFGNPFPSEDIVRIIEDGKTKYWNVCKSFETDDADIMKSFQALFDDHPTDKHDVTDKYVGGKKKGGKRYGMQNLSREKNLF